MEPCQGFGSFRHWPSGASDLVQAWQPYAWPSSAVCGRWPLTWIFWSLWWVGWGAGPLADSLLGEMLTGSMCESVHRL